MSELIDKCAGITDAELRAASGCDTTGQAPDLVVNIINVVVGVLGLVCVIMIVKGGIQYLQSTGNPDKVKQGKMTIIYSVIGLLICVLAFAIVNFAIGAVE